MTTTHELDCSDGARMMIERVRTNPEDFDYGGKLYRMAEQVQMSARDKKAISEAHDTYIKEPRLMAEVLKALLVQPEENETLKFRSAMTLDSAGNLGIGTQGRYAAGHIDARTIYGSPIQNDLTTQQRITREMYEDHIQTHQSHIKKHIQAVAAEKESVAAQIYNKAFGRERIERDN